MSFLKAFLNVALLRGRNRLPRLFFLLALTAFIFTIAKLSVCNLQPSLCGNEEEVKHEEEVVRIFKGRPLLSKGDSSIVVNGQRMPIEDRGRRDKSDDVVEVDDDDAAVVEVDDAQENEEEEEEEEEEEVGVAKKVGKKIKNNEGEEEEEEVGVAKKVGKKIKNNEGEEEEEEVGVAKVGKKDKEGVEEEEVGLAKVGKNKEGEEEEEVGVAKNVGKKIKNKEEEEEVGMAKNKNKEGVVGKKGGVDKKKSGKKVDKGKGGVAKVDSDVDVRRGNPEGDEGVARKELQGVGGMAREREEPEGDGGVVLVGEEPEGVVGEEPEGDGGVAGKEVEGDADVAVRDEEEGGAKEEEGGAKADEDKGDGSDDKEDKEEEEEEEGGEGRMSAAAVAEAIQSGTMCKTVCPPFTWSDWSPCSKACGRGRRYRKAIYEFVCKMSDQCPSNRVEEDVCEQPCKFDPEKYGGPDGLDLYPNNPLNPPMYPGDPKYMCGHWLVEYEKIHNEIVTGKRAPSYLIYSTGSGDYPTAGGLSSRLRGITTVFFMAVLLDRAFMIEWKDPDGLENYLVPKSFDWANLKPTIGHKHGAPLDIGSWHSSKEGKMSSQWYMNTNFSQFFKNPVEVIQGHRYDFTYAILRNPELMPKAYELGIDRVRCRVCCAWDLLFTMAPNFEKEMGKILQSLGPPSKPIMAIQVRTKSDDVQKAVVTAEHYINCAQKVAKDVKMVPTYIPIFNNRLVVHIIAKKYKRYIKTPIEIESGTRTVHTHLGNLPADTELEVVHGVQERTFKEFFLMLNSTILIRTKGYVGSFGTVADAIRRHYAKSGSVITYTAGGSSCGLFPIDSKIE